MLVKSLKRSLALRIQVKLLDGVVLLIKQAFHINPSWLSDSQPQSSLVLKCLYLPRLNLETICFHSLFFLERFVHSHRVIEGLDVVFTAFFEVYDYFAKILWLLGLTTNRHCLIDHFQRLRHLWNVHTFQRCGVFSAEIFLFPHVQILCCWLIVVHHRIMRFLNFLVHFKTSKNILKLSLVAELDGRIWSDQKQAWITNCLRRGQEFAFFLDKFAIINPRGFWLLVFNAFNHLVEVKGNGKFLSAVSISINNEMVTLLVFSPDATPF